MGKDTEYYEKNKERILSKSAEHDKLTGRSTVFYRTQLAPAVFKRDNYQCVRCKSTKNLLVHHKNYNQNLTITDLETVCKSCHKLEHVESHKEKIG